MSLVDKLRNQILSETVDVDVSGVKIEKLPDIYLPTLWPVMLSEIRQRHRGRVATLPEREFFLLPEKGFFFHYNPTDKVYYEGQASFMFVEGFKFPTYSNVPKRSPELKLYWNHFNFAVDHKAHSIDIQKSFFDNILKTATLDNLYGVQQALKVVMQQHPGLAKYRVIGTKLRTKNAKEFLELDTEEDLGKKTVIRAYWGTTSTNLRQATESKYTPPKGGDVMWFDPQIAKGEADAAKSRHRHVYLATAVLDLPAQKELWSGKNFIGDIKKEYVVSYETPEPDFESTERHEQKYEKCNFAWKSKYSSIVIAGGASYKAIYNSGEDWTSGARRNKTHHSAQRQLEDGYAEISRKNENKILLVDKDKFTEKGLWKILVKRGALEYRSWGDLPTQQEQEEWLKLFTDPDVFEDKLKHQVIEVLLNPESRDYSHSQAMGAAWNLGLKLSRNR